MQELILIDDNKSERDTMTELLSEKLGDDVKVTPFIGNEDKLREGESYEQFLLRWFTNIKPNFIACDKELGSYRKFAGLSATPVSSVASDLGIPFCLYSRQPDDSSREFDKYKSLRKWSTDEIILEGTTPQHWSEQIVKLYKGFKVIEERYLELGVEKTPPAALATILDHPKAESRIALYGSGGQNYLMDTLPFYEVSNEVTTELRHRMIRVLGNWLLLSILRFPGITVNKAAAGSYLNLNPVHLENPTIQKALNPAFYKGPFYDLENWWWRDDLDVVLESHGVEDGLALAKKLNVEAEPCVDAQTNEPAGYYCMITGKAVSASNSSSNISWFPSGADLARIRKDKYNQITALVGMY